MDEYTIFTVDVYKGDNCYESFHRSCSLSDAEHSFRMLSEAGISCVMEKSTFQVLVTTPLARHTSERWETYLREMEAENEH